jgi:hypothetical protein
VRSNKNCINYRWNWNIVESDLNNLKPVNNLRIVCPLSELSLFFKTSITHDLYNLQFKYISPLLRRPHLLQWKSGPIRGVASPEEDNLLIIYYLSASEIWPDKRGSLWWEWSDKRGSLWWEWPIKRGTTGFTFTWIVDYINHGLLMF